MLVSFKIRADPQNTKFFYSEPAKRIFRNTSEWIFKSSDFLVRFGVAKRARDGVRYGAFACGKRFRRHSHLLPIPYGHKPARVHPRGTQDTQNGVGDFPGNCYMTRPINGDTRQGRELGGIAREKIGFVISSNDICRFFWSFLVICFFFTINIISQMSWMSLPIFRKAIFTHVFDDWWGEKLLYCS